MKKMNISAFKRIALVAILSIFLNVCSKNETPQAKNLMASTVPNPISEKTVSIKIIKIGDREVAPNTKLVVSKPMPVTVQGSFENLGNNNIYILQTGQDETNVWHIQPNPAIDELNHTFTGNVWFGDNKGPGNRKYFTLVAIVTKEEIKLRDGDNPVKSIPNHIVRTPKIQVYREDKDSR